MKSAKWLVQSFTHSLCNCEAISYLRFCTKPLMQGLDYWGPPLYIYWPRAGCWNLIPRKGTDNFSLYISGTFSSSSQMRINLAEVLNWLLIWVEQCRGISCIQFYPHVYYTVVNLGGMKAAKLLYVLTLLNLVTVVHMY